MSIPYKLIDLFARTPMNADGTYTIDAATYRADAENEFWVNAYATFTVIDYIANLMSMVQFHTYDKGKMIKGFEWHRLNIKPNINQSAADFKKEYWAKLLYYGEVLVVSYQDQLIIADDFFHHEEFGVREDYFENVTRGDFTFYKRFKRSEVFYQKYTAMETCGLQNVLGMYSSMISIAHEMYKNSGGERGVLNVNAAANGPQDFEAKYGAWINKRFKSYFKGKNAVMPLFKGMTYTGKQTEVDQKASSDFINLMDSALARACNSYKIPPAILRGEVAGMSDAFDVFLTTCADPLAQAAANEFTAQEFTAAQIVSGSRIQAFTNTIKHTDVFACASNFDKLFQDGMSYNTLMELLDMPTIDEEWANKHYITKNYADANAPVPQEGGNDA